MLTYKPMDLSDLFTSTSRMTQDLLAIDMSVPKLERIFQKSADFFYRDGLGKWRGVGIEIEGHGKVVFTVQEDDAHKMGAAVWIEVKKSIDENTVIELIEQIKGDKEVRYMNPISGKMLYPTPK